MLHLDFETFSEVNLKSAGAYRYAADQSTEVLCACWAVGEGEVQSWVPCISADEADLYGLPDDWFYGPTVPKPLAVEVKRGTKIIAHNATFERAIWQAVVHARMGGPSTTPEQFGCTAARAAAAGLPRGLEGAASALGVKQQKDENGKRLLKIFAQRRKATKKDPRTRIKPLDLHTEFINLVSYCQQDVRAERDIDKVIPQLHPVEQRLFHFDMRINERGLLIDIPLVRKAQAVVSSLEADIIAEVRSLTKSKEYPEGLRPTQRDKMLKFFWDNGVMLENMQADHVRKYMAKNFKALSELARRLLLLRMEAGKASTKKLASMMAYCMEHEFRARGTILFYGAHTGRFSGKGIQPHNFIRGTLKWEEQLRIFALLEHEDPDIFKMLYEWPITAISQCMRGFIVAPKGKILRVVDYSSIEARVLAWIALEEEVLQAYRKGVDVYKLMASKLYGVPIEEVTSEQRRIGKNLVLGCGYGLGAAKFVQYSEKAGTEISEQFAKAAVKAYRDGHRMIVRMWGDVERCAIEAVRKAATAARPVVLRNLQFFMDGQWLCIKLPVGRCLRYFRPKVQATEKWGEPALQLTFKTELGGRLFTESTYGGKLVENIVQAVARDILVNGMFEAEDEGYPVIGTVHDELLTEPEVEFGSVEHLEEVVCRLPSWAEGLPIGAEGFESPRYKKG